MTRPAVRLVVVALAFAAACGGGNTAVKGAHLVTDAAGDHAAAVNGLGKTPVKPLASGDIAGVRLDAKGTTLTIRIAIEGSPMAGLPKDPKQGPAWFLQAWADPKSAKGPSYFVVIVRDGPAKETAGAVTGWRLSVCAGQDVCTKPVPGGKLTMTAREVRASVPLKQLPLLKKKFGWVALSYWNDTLDPLRAWSDWVPDNARPVGGPDAVPPPESRYVFPPPA